MESSYMKIYKNIINKKNKNKFNKSRHNSKHQLKKNKSQTYYNYDRQTNYINKFQINELNINNNKTISNNSKNNYNKNINKDNKNNTSYCFFSENETNHNYLLRAYKKSVSELFKTLKLYMNNELYKFHKLKKEFLQNIQKFYNEEKKKEKRININKTQINNNIKPYSKKKLNGSKNIHIYDELIKTYNFTHSHKCNKFNNHNTKKNLNKSMNTSYISGASLTKNQDKINYNSFNNHNNNHKSLYTLLKKNNNILVNSPMKKERNNRNDNIMKKFLIFTKVNKNVINRICNQSVVENNKLILNEKNNDNCKVSEKITKNNELISKIKDSLDDNLKHIFNFSYENFLNKESERECN